MTEGKYCPLYTDMILLIFTNKIHDFVIFLVAKMGSNYPESSWFLEMCSWWANELKDVCSVPV